MRVRWTILAAEDLDRIAHRIKEDNPKAAFEVASTIYDGCAELATFPRRGRTGRIDSTRELVFPGLPFIVVYRIRNESVEILRIYHGAQDWP